MSDKIARQVIPERPTLVDRMVPLLSLRRLGITEGQITVTNLVNDVPEQGQIVFSGAQHEERIRPMVEQALLNLGYAAKARGDSYTDFEKRCVNPGEYERRVVTYISDDSQFFVNVKRTDRPRVTPKNEIYLI